MTNLKKLALGLFAGLLALPVTAAAQTSDIPGFDAVVAEIQERVAGNRYKMTGSVELSQDTMKFYADEVEYFGDTDRLVATGNVLITERDHQIAADRADFNAKTRLGTFYNARGFAAMGPQADASAFGTLQPDVQFYGETIEKVGTDTYLITRGGFTTCAQATPRWEMTSGTLRLRVDHYALLRHTVLKVKGVPALYLPIMYYPLSKDNRSTGFLMPSYGSSTIQGQIIGNAFFWAINRSQDATIQHDWYSKTGQQIAGEYRYVSLLGGGNLRTNFLNERPTIYINPIDSTESIQPGRKSYNLNGSLSQGLGRGWHAQGRADYSSNLLIRQLYSTDFTQASNRNRVLGGSLTGTYDRNEYFYDTGNTSLRGNSPRINVSRPDRTLGGLPLYYSVGTDYVHLISQSRSSDGELTLKNDIDRLDVVPVIRFPYTRLPFLALNTSLMWRNTFWSDSQDLVTSQRVDVPISRRFFEMVADVTGPTVVRIWDAPNSTYAQRFKHSIEPFLRLTHRTPIENARRIVRNDYQDGFVGGMTEYSYGANTRLYAKKTDGGPLSVPREIIGATIRQTYYTDAEAAKNDQAYRSNNAQPPTRFSPVSLTVRTSPAQQVNGTFRTDFDGRYSRFRSFGADGSWNNSRVSLLAGWSQYRFYPDITGKNVATPTHYFNSNTTVRFQQNRYGVLHSFNYDVKKNSILQMRIAGYYNAQCCGFTAEYQTVDLRGLGTRAPVQEDSRFHFSVTLAGIGNVSNIFGGLGGTPNR
jgi:LPS-assembly protein